MERKDYRLAAILYTDIAGFSKMMEKNEGRTLELLHAHNAIIEEIVARRKGTVIKTIGDAFLIDFKNTVDALQTALEIQYKLYERNAASPDLPILVRIGLHLGDIYFYENDALGEGINIAARLQSVAHPGCICMSEDVYNLVLNKVDFTAEKLGPVSLKNITKEIRVYEIVTPNVEFDPNRDARPILRPDKADKAAAPAARTAPVADAEGGEAAADIKRRIMLDIKAAGRRLGADQMRIRYGAEGPAAERVIAELAEKGILLSGPEPSPGVRPRLPAPATPRPLEDEIGETVREVSRAVREAVREARRERHRYTAEGVREGAVVGRTGRESAEVSDGGSEAYEAYARKVRGDAAGAAGGFVAHLIPFVAVNGFLMTVNARVSPNFPWALFPLGGWGIGLLEHYTSVLRNRDKRRELEALPAMRSGQLEIFKKLQKKKDALWHNAVSTVSTGAFLWMINAVTSPSFWWSFIPIFFMGVGLLSHLGSYAKKSRELDAALAASFGLSGPAWRRKLGRVGGEVGARADDYGVYADQVAQARSARDAIVRMVGGERKPEKRGEKPKPSLPVGEELLPVLDNYVDQVSLLARKTVEVDGIIEAIPRSALKADRERLAAKLEADPVPSMRGEYEKSLAEIDRQEQSFEELKNQRELLELKMRSSVNALKQMQIDLGRLSGMSGEADAGTNRAIQEKTRELNRYLEDLRSGYRELELLEDEASAGS